MLGPILALPHMSSWHGT